MLEEARESRGGICMTVDEFVSHGDEPVEFHVNDKVLTMQVT